MKLLTITEAAKLIGVKRTNIYYYIKKGLPSYMHEATWTGHHSAVTTCITKHVDEAELLAFYKQHRENNVDNV